MIRPDRSDVSAYRKILSAASSGELTKLRNGLYAEPEALLGSVVDIDAIVPGGILCQYSAWSYYNLCTQVPDAFYVAVERSRKLCLPPFPDIKLIFQKKELLEIGMTRIIEDGIGLNITDIERSVCDAVKYRNKIGIDVMREIIENYLRRPERDLTRLTDYAGRLRVLSTLLPILQVKI